MERRAVQIRWREQEAKGVAGGGEQPRRQEGQKVMIGFFLPAAEAKYGVQRGLFSMIWEGVVSGYNEFLSSSLERRVTSPHSVRQGLRGGASSRSV